MLKGQYLQTGTNLLTQFKGKQIPEKRTMKLHYNGFLFIIELEVIKNVFPTLSAIQGRHAISTYFPVELWNNPEAIQVTASRIFRSMAKNQTV